MPELIMNAVRATYRGLFGLPSGLAFQRLSALGHLPIPKSFSSTGVVREDKSIKSEHETTDSAAIPEEVSETVERHKTDKMELDFPEDADREMVDMWKDSPAGREWNGPRGFEPTRYGDWACKGRVSDF